MNFDNIGYFQFDNLLQSRIPMILVLLDDVAIKPWYNSLVGMHIDNISLRTTSEKAVGEVQAKKMPLHYAVVVLDNDESKSPAVVRELDELGFLNVYYVKGGFQGISQERQSPNQ